MTECPKDRRSGSTPLRRTGSVVTGALAAPPEKRNDSATGYVSQILDGMRGVCAFVAPLCTVDC